MANAHLCYCCFSFQLYELALQLALQAYGENSVMGERLHLNTGIYYEDARQYQKAGEFFVKWCDICEEVGPGIIVILG